MTLLAFDAIGEFDGSYPFAWEIKAFHVNLLLISKFVHKPSAHELLKRDLCTPKCTPQAKNVSCAIIHVAYRGKNKNPNQHIYSAQ
jgi:hypothetical protein